jgi:hypothetical protein
MLADAAAVADGKLYVHGGGWSRLLVEAIPARYPGFALVFALEVDEDDRPGRIPLAFTVVAGDEPTAEVRGWVDVSDPRPAATITNQVTFADVPLPVAGDYTVRIASGDVELGGVGLHVARRGGPPDDGLVRALVEDARRPRA